MEDSQLEMPPGTAAIPQQGIDPVLRRSTRIACTVGIVLLLLVGAFLRIWALGRQPLNSDEAVVGLMAHEILHGHFFAFYWGQSYGGGEPYVVALVFALLGQSSFTLALTPVLLDAASAVLVALLGRRLFSLRVGIAAMLLYWTWSEVYIWQSTLEYGFRWVALICGLSTALLALQIGEPTSSHRRFTLAALGVFAGIGWWSTPEIAYYLVPVLLLLGYRVARRRLSISYTDALLALGGFVVGAFPWIWANVRSGFASLHAGNTPDPHFLSHLKTLAEHSLPMVLGLQLWSPTYDLLGTGHWVLGATAGRAVAAALMLAGAFWLAVLALSRRAGLLVLFMGVFPFVFALSPFTYYWLDGRYGIFLPPMAALLGVAGAAELGAVLSRRFHRRLTMAPVVATLVIGLALTGWAVDNRSPYVANHVPGSTSQTWTSWTPDPSGYVAQLADGLEDQGFRTLYAGYWVSYMLDLESHGAIVASDVRVVRYAPYLARVVSDPKAAWLFVREVHRGRAALHFGDAPLLDPGCADEGQRCLDAREFGLYLAHVGITYRSAVIGDFIVVRPSREVDAKTVLRYFDIIPPVAAN